VLDTPYDLIRTDDIRDDLIAVKVWYSTTPDFDPKQGQGTLAFNGAGLSIIISNLSTNTRYYVKYAFISAIDPNVFTVSAALTSVVFDEDVSIYGYLTNDPTSVNIETSGSGDWSVSQGVFKVFDLSQDVTGNGPIYSIKPNGITGGVTGSINPVTGAYSASAMVSNTGTITFYATYKNIIVEKIWNITKIRTGVDGTDGPNLRIIATGTAFVYKDDFASVSESTSVSFSSVIANLIGTPTYTAFAYTRAGVLLGPVALSISGSTASLSAANFNPTVYNNTVGYVNVTSSLGLLSDTVTIYRNNDGSEQITVEQTNQAHVITAFTDGEVPLANYVGSGTIIKVKQGSNYLALDNSAPYPNGTWRLTGITSTGITADPTPTVGLDYVNFDQHANMTADIASITYEITGITTTGKPFVLTTQQSFSKSKAGIKGSDAPILTLTASTQTFTVAKNTGIVSPINASITATVINMQNETIAWYIDDELQPGEVNSTLVVPSFTGTPKLVKAIATSGDITAFDQLTLYSLREGDDAIQAGLANENQTIACDSSGEPIDGQLPVTSEMITVRGNVELLTGVTYSIVEQVNLTASINSTTGVIQVTAINAISGYVKVRATIGTLNIDKILTINKSINGAFGGPPGPVGPIVQISGLTTFYRNAGDLISPANLLLEAVVQNITSPSYSWVITGATPATATGTTVTITPTGVETITARLTVTGSNILNPISITRGTSIIDQGITGQAGQNGVMSAFPTIYRWTSGSQPSRPTTNSTYTWATGGFTPPVEWSTTVPNNTTSGWVLWQITVPLTVTAETTTSALNWTSTVYDIRSTSVNGAPGDPGTNGSATYLINRGAVNSSAQPTAAEVLAATGTRYAQLGDIATISYNSGNNSVAYRATSSGFSATWALQTSYITGSLIVQNSISGDRIIANSLSVSKITSGSTGVSVINVNGETVTGSFALGSGERTPLGNTAAIGGFVCSTNTGWALAGFNTNTSAGEWGNGVLAGTRSPGGAGLGAYTVVLQTAGTTNVRSASVVAETGVGMYAIYTKSTSWTQQAKENNLGSVNLRAYGGIAFPNYGLRGEAYGNLANVLQVGEQAFSVAIGELAYCSDNQDSAYAALLVRRHATGTSKGDEACRVIVAPSWNPTRAIEVSGGAPYTGTIGHFPGGITNFTGVHESQSNVELTVGDIVADQAILYKEDVANVFSSIVPSTVANDKTVFGVVAHNQENKRIPFIPDSDSMSVPAQGFVPSTVEIARELEPWKLKYTVLVNALGEGQVNVCGENGNIQAGDLIVTSSIPGKGMRQADDIIRSYTVAKARESVTFDSPTQVKMIACTYHCG
jgi:hypothetical protein